MLYSTELPHQSNRLVQIISTTGPSLSHHRQCAFSCIHPRAIRYKVSSFAPLSSKLSQRLKDERWYNHPLLHLNVRECLPLHVCSIPYRSLPSSSHPEAEAAKCKKKSKHDTFYLERCEPTVSYSFVDAGAGREHNHPRTSPTTTVWGEAGQLAGKTVQQSKRDHAHCQCFPLPSSVH